MTDEASATVDSITAERKRFDLMELCVGYALILLVIWTPRPWQRALYWLPVLWTLVVSWLSFDG